MYHQMYPTEWTSVKCGSDIATIKEENALENVSKISMDLSRPQCVSKSTLESVTEQLHNNVAHITPITKQTFLEKPTLHL